MSIFIFLGVCFAIWYIVSAVLYSQTDYARTTHKSFAAMRFNTGNYGEYLTYLYLRKYEKDGAKFLYNCYLPRDNNQTTEIDVLMIHSSGVYVFESKNYSGWIFGSEHQKNWTQTLPSGRKAHKEHFLNPIMQNKLHIKWLLNQIGQDNLVHSVIVFSERCTLKKVDVTSPDIYVIKRDRVKSTVDKIAHKNPGRISEARILEIYDKLYSFTQVSDALKAKHIQDINEAFSEDIIVANVSADVSPEADKEAEPTCPKCGGKLVLKTSKRGAHAGNQFYGCSNYPKCRYIGNIFMEKN